MASIQSVVEADCTILLMRALYKQPLVAFGDDGLGKYGKCSMPQTYTVDDVDVIVILEDNQGILGLVLDGYDAQKFGHIATDKNFMINVQQLLSAIGVDPTCVTYAPINRQGRNFVTFDFDIAKLLSWP